MCLRVAPVALFSFALGIGCGTDPRDPRPPREGGGEGEVDGAIDAPFGLVVVDVQETFVAGAANSDLDEIIARTADLLTFAGENGVPTFVSYEAAKTGDHALDARLTLPAGATEYVKTTFDANGLPAFASALEESGLTRFAVVGSETDVCVLQTVLGLRRSGYTVLLVEDAVFSSEPSPASAFARMEQTGVSLVRAADVAGFGALPDAPMRAVPRATPGEVAILIDHLDDATLAAANDPFANAKLARLKELVLISEWFGVPLFTSDGTLPAQLAAERSLPVGTAADLTSAWEYTQIVVAGSDTALPVHTHAQTVFVMTDAIVATGDTLAETLAARVDAGDVPLTYKTLYYELTGTVAFEDWPADWIERDAEYYQRTLAPEDLPPVH